MRSNFICLTLFVTWNSINNASNPSSLGLGLLIHLRNRNGITGTEVEFFLAAEKFDPCTVALRWQPLLLGYGRQRLPNVLVGQEELSVKSAMPYEGSVDSLRMGNVYSRRSFSSLSSNLGQQLEFRRVS